MNVHVLTAGASKACLQDEMFVLTTRHVLAEGMLVRHVTHHYDDSWTFTCGTADHASVGLPITLGRLLSRDPSLRSIPDLPPGWSAWRTYASSPWMRYKEDEMFSLDVQSRAA